MDIEDEKENSSGLVYILQTKRLARIVKDNRVRQDAEAGGEVEGMAENK